MKYQFVKTAILVLIAAGLAFAQAPPVPPEPAQPPRPPRLPVGAHLAMADREDRGYRSGQNHLDHRRYDQAIQEFNRVIADKSPRADGALYWRAYAENKLGKRSEARATLAELRKTYPNSRWLDDAKSLEVEIGQASGAGVSPENTTDEDTKILVLNSMINTDPDRSVPILEKLLKGSSSPKVKERALFVLAQSRSPKARDLILQVAKGHYNPDLQNTAVEYLGVYGGRDNAQTLVDVYKSAGDAQLKRAVLHGLMISGNRDAVLSIARSESNPELRAEAIHQVGIMGGSADLLQLYTPDAPVETKRAILQAMFIGGNSDKISEIAGSDKDPALRREAIRQLGMLGRRKGVDGLSGLYAKETDPQNKREILNAMFIQGNAPGIIEIARKEKDPGLKREAVQKLSLMQSKESTDYLMELLNK